MTRLGPLLALLLCAPAARAACTRAHDLELEALIPREIQARLAAMPGERAKAAAEFMGRHPELTLRFAVRPRQAVKHPTLPLMNDRALMQFMPGKGYTIAHESLHDEGWSEEKLYKDKAARAAFIDSILPVWVHELAHAARLERPARWPVSPTIENELAGCYSQALFAAEALSTDPGFAGLKGVYRAMRVAEKGGPGTRAAYYKIPAAKRTTVEALEIAAGSGEEFERLYRKAYDGISSLNDPLTAGLKITHRRGELAALLGTIKSIPPAQRASAEELLDFGKNDDAFWLDSSLTMAARDDSDKELAGLRKELDARRPAVRAWFEAANGGPVDFARLAEPAEKFVGVAPSDSE